MTKNLSNPSYKYYSCEGNEKYKDPLYISSNKRKKVTNTKCSQEHSLINTEIKKNLDNTNITPPSSSLSKNEKIFRGKQLKFIVLGKKRK